MRYVVLTSDRHNFLLKGYTELFNTFWDDTIQVDVVGFSEPSVDLPDNFNFVSMGDQIVDYNNAWGPPVIDYMNSIDDEYFFMAFDDHYIASKVDTELFGEALTYLDGSIDKVYLMVDDRRLESHYKDNFWNAKDVPHCNVTTSLLPSIWRREYFLTLISPGHITPHQFETSLNPKVLGCKTIQPRKIIYPNVDAYRRGKFNKRAIDQYNSYKMYDYGTWNIPMTEQAYNTLKRAESRFQ